MIQEFQKVIWALEGDEHVKVAVFDSAADDYFLNHSDFTGKIEDLTGLPNGPTGLAPWPDFPIRLLACQSPQLLLFVAGQPATAARSLSPAT